MKFTYEMNKILCVVVNQTAPYTTAPPPQPPNPSSSRVVNLYIGPDFRNFHAVKML